MSPYYTKLRDALGHELLIIPSVAAVIHDDQSRLLLQEKHDGSWSLPAGAIELGESPEQAVAREVMEETGMLCGSMSILGVFGGEKFRHVYPNMDQVEYVITLFKCEAKIHSVIQDTNETKSIRYFSQGELPKLALPYDPIFLYS